MPQRVSLPSGSLGPKSQNDTNEFSNQKLASYNFFENSFMKNKVLWKKKFFLWKIKFYGKKSFFYGKKMFCPCVSGTGRGPESESEIFLYCLYLEICLYL